MSPELTVTRQDESPGHIIFTRSDGQVFHLVWHESGQASLYHKDKPPPGGINLDVNIADKPACAAEWILGYPEGWP